MSRPQRSVSDPVEGREEESIEELLERVERRLQKMLASYRIPRGEGEDLVQDAVLSLVVKQEQIRDPEAWLVATLKNRCLMFWRSRRIWKRHGLTREVENPVGFQIGLEMAVDEYPQRPVEIRGDLERALRKLPPEWARLLWLSFVLGCKPEEVAWACGYEWGSIRQIRRRALKRLREIYEGGGGEMEEVAPGSGALSREWKEMALARLAEGRQRRGRDE